MIFDQISENTIIYNQFTYRGNSDFLNAKNLQCKVPAFLVKPILMN